MDDWTPVELEKYPLISETVKQMAQTNLSGDCLYIPHIWTQKIRYATGLAHFNACVILADAIYQYTPYAKDIEEGDKVLRVLVQKFEGKKWQTRYGDYKSRLGLSKQQARDGIKKLADMGLMSVELAQDNHLSLDLNLDKIKELTFS